MNSDVKGIAGWAESQGWRVEDDQKGYTRFYAPDGTYIVGYPATPSRPYRRMQELRVKLKKAGLPIPPPSKKEQRAQRKNGEQK